MDWACRKLCPRYSECELEMIEHAIIFNAIVVMAFLVQIYNYYELGYDRVNHYTWLFVLGCFVVTETMVALINPVYSLYVLLNLWGIWSLLRGHNDVH